MWLSTGLSSFVRHSIFFSSSVNISGNQLVLNIMGYFTFVIGDEFSCDINYLEHVRGMINKQDQLLELQTFDSSRDSIRMWDMNAN